MNHVIGGDQEAYLGVHGNHHGFIHFQQVVLALGLGVVDLALRGTQVAEKADVLAILVDVFVLPFPLVASDQDIHFSIFEIVDLKQGGRGGNRHADKDQEGHHCPGNLHLGALVKVRGFVALGLAMVDDRIEHHPEHADTDNRADTQDDHVQVVDALADMGGAG